MRIIDNNPSAAPLVSVLVPVYNTAKFLPVCLDSLLSQTLEDIEIICLNDGSTDNSLDILLDYHQRDSRICVVDKPNAGYGATMNLGVSLARAPYVGILESDDFAEPTMFEKLYRFASSQNCDLVKCNYFEHSDGVDVEQRPFDGFPYGQVFDPRENIWILTVLPIIWAALYRKGMLEENGIRFSETPGASFQDTSFVHQSLIAARRFGLLPDPLIHYRVDNAGSSVKSSAKVFEVCGEYAITQDFLRQDPERQAAFGSIIHLMKLNTYKWNYERVDEAGKAAFAGRMCEEFRAADQDGTLDPGFFNEAEWSLIQDIMAGPDVVTARYPETLEEPMLFGDDMHPLSVSVVLAIYNVEKYLPQCLDSLLGQTFDNIEVICVNDGSTDGSGTVLAEYAARDSRVKVIEKQNSGYGDSMNRGIAAATGDYIGIVEPDDWADASMYETLIRAARRNGLPDIVKGSYWRVCEADTPQEHIEPAIYLHRIPTVGRVFTLDQDADFLLHHPSIWTAIYKRSFLDEFNVRFYPIPGSGWSDNPFLMESLTSARSILYVDEPLYNYREFSAELAGGQTNPEIIAARWLEMDEILKRKGITAPKILEGHYARGCAYIQMLDEDFPHDATAMAGVSLIMERLDPVAICKSRKIIRPFKVAYSRHLDTVRRVPFVLLMR